MGNDIVPPWPLSISAKPVLTLPHFTSNALPSVVAVQETEYISGSSTTVVVQSGCSAGNANSVGSPVSSAHTTSWSLPVNTGLPFASIQYCEGYSSMLMWRTPNTFTGNVPLCTVSPSCQLTCTFFNPAEVMSASTVQSAPSMTVPSSSSKE